MPRLSPCVDCGAPCTAAVDTVGGAKEKRYVLPNSRVLIHQPLIRGVLTGPATELDIEAKEILRLRNRIYEILASHTGQASETIEQARATMATTSELRGHLFLALAKGRYLRALRDPAAGDTLLQVIDTARSMNDRSSELLAATELAQHFEAQDRRAEARAVLEPICTWFTEGLDTTALLSAAEVLERLG